MSGLSDVSTILLCFCATKAGADQESDLFIRNMTTNQTVWLSPGLPVGADPAGVVISPNGRWVSSRWNDGSLHLTRVDTRVTSTETSRSWSVAGPIITPRTGGTSA